MLIEIGIAASIGGIVGFGTCAVLTAGKVADERAQADAINEALHKAHTRCADALTTCQRKLSAIRDLLDTPRTIRKGELASILDGDA